MDTARDGIKFRRSIQYTLSFVAVIWLVKIIESYLQIDFGLLGIYPRTLSGSIGIFLSPLIHGDFFHLLSNTFPLLILGVGLFYFYDKIAFNVIILIYLMTGFWVWIAARDAYHIGASGIVYGLLTFILFSGFFRRNPQTLAISFVILVLYGGSFMAGIIPTSNGISWESHLMGGIAGIFCAVYFRKAKLVDEPPLDIKPIDQNSPFDYTYTYLENSQKSESYIYTINTKSKEESRARRK
ncbi:rhomboid family intramembrane serine protease [Fulvivirga lutimaris]|uniref:rhomboid family intramembrane serine protease n=1 Tax=Fulvivirga lutimaris TaxID=1819566 RepID=UPI0012BD1366|nr:rhomboid family intramembrane serine protease [Fulvivirga lutimaris]MTI38950.1 rhomboid family intramembrane serine protease [Fulvivirga lutimaris]